MKWLILAAGAIVAAMAIWILWRERQHATRSSFRGLMATLLCLAIFGGVVYAAHYVGFFSLPIIAVAFVPIGLGLRWSSMLGRDGRARREAMLAPVERSPGARARELLMWPVMVALVLLVAGAAYAAAVLASIR